MTKPKWNTNKAQQPKKGSADDKSSDDWSDLPFFAALRGEKREGNTENQTETEQEKAQKDVKSPEKSAKTAQNDVKPPENGTQSPQNVAKAPQNNTQMPQNSAQTPQNSTKPEPKKQPSSAKTEQPEPATPLMKKVAASAPRAKEINKTFTEEERKELAQQREEKSESEKTAAQVTRERYRKIKRLVKEMEDRNNNRVIVFPSLTTGEGWYKVAGFSALYYVYRLSERMGRSARMMPDTDRCAKIRYAASLRNIDKFVEQFRRLEDPALEITEDGIYIFTLKRALTDDEVGALRRVEETRQEQINNTVRPKQMEPAVYQAILMVVRQVLPRVRKLEKPYYQSLGERLINGIYGVMSQYMCYAEGLTNKQEAGKELLKQVDEILAGILMMMELGVWQHDVILHMSENVMEIKHHVKEEFGMDLKRPAAKKTGGAANGGAKAAGGATGDAANGAAAGGTANGGAATGEVRHG